ncbi:MAG: hypothetical protein QM753_03165 [Thermomicrobiales bacterium]
MLSPPAPQRRLATIIWLAIVLPVLWLHATTLLQRFHDDRALKGLLPGEADATRAALDRIGLTTTAWASLWLSSSLLFIGLYLVLGWLLVRRGRPAGFATWLACIAISLTALVYPPSIPEVFANQPIQQVIVKTTTMLGVSGMFILPLVFPTGRFVPRWTILIGIYVMAEMVLFAWTGAGTPSGPPWLEAILTVLLATAILGSAIYRYRRRSTTDQRRQMRWVLFGFLIGIPCFFTGDAMMRSIDDSPRGAVFAIVFPVLVQIGFNAAFLAVIMAVLYHRLFDIDVVLGKTLVWMAMSGLVVGAYIVVVIGLGKLFGAHDSLILSIIATGSSP